MLQALEQQASANFRPDATPGSLECKYVLIGSRAGELGLTTQKLVRQLRQQLKVQPTQLQRGDRLVDIRVQLNEDAITQPSQLEWLPLFIDNNRQIRLSDVARIERSGSGEIQ